MTGTSSADQDEQRRRRRGRLPVVYRGTFDLVAEVEATCAPLAERIAASPAPGAYSTAVADLVTAVHQAVLDLGDVIAAREARHRTTHLSAETRPRAVQLIVQTRPRPECPVAAPHTLVTGAWAEILSEHARPLSGPLAEYLGVALAPGHTRGAVSVSEHVEAALRGVDRAALSCERLLDRLQTTATRASASAPLDPAEELRTLGVSPLGELPETHKPTDAGRSGPSSAATGDSRRGGLAVGRTRRESLPHRRIPHGKARR